LHRDAKVANPDRLSGRAPAFAFWHGTSFRPICEIGDNSEGPTVPVASWEWWGLPEAGPSTSSGVFEWQTK